MKPPTCWGQEKIKSAPAESPTHSRSVRVAESPFIDTGALLRQSKQNDKSIELDHFTKDLLGLQEALSESPVPALQAVQQNLQQVLSAASSGYESLGREERQARARALSKSWAFAKVS